MVSKFSMRRHRSYRRARNKLCLSENSLGLSLMSFRSFNFNLFLEGIIDLPESLKNCKCLEQFEASVNPIGK